MGDINSTAIVYQDEFGKWISKVVIYGCQTEAQAEKLVLMAHEAITKRFKEFRNEQET